MCDNEDNIEIVQSETENAEVAEPGVELTDKGFRLANKWVLLTYGSKDKDTWIDKAEYIKWIQEKCKHEVNWIRLAHESADAKAPYLHTHVVMEHATKFTTTSCRFFDYKGDHPNIKKLIVKKAFIDAQGYIGKEDIANKDLKKEFVPNLVEGILKCKTDKEALTKFCKTPANAAGILAIRGIQSFDFRSEKVLVEPKHKWQLDFLEMIKEKANRRSVVWIKDKVGNRGKSELGDYIQDTSNGDWCVLSEVSQTRDLAELILTELMGGWKCQGVIFDLTASASEHKGFYDGIECIKNGRISSQKYKGKTLRFDIPHVAVFANFLPDVNRMKLDRWKIFEINKHLELTPIDAYKLANEPREEYSGSTLGGV